MSENIRAMEGGGTTWSTWEEPRDADRTTNSGVVADPGWASRRGPLEARSGGDYSLLRPLARGGMGEVWVAWQADLGCEVAVKILRTDRLSERALRRFEREARVSAQLTHPNAIRVYHYGGTPDGLWFYAMELLQGQDLASTVSAQGPMCPRRAVGILLQVSGALADAHARGIVHRDIKPQNVFLCNGPGVRDFAKVLDFGIAKQADSEGLSRDVDSERAAGTPAYASPEVALGGLADFRSDVYGMGCLLYFLLTGSPPFFGSNGAALLEAHAQRRPERPSLRRGESIAPALECFVMRCLAKEPHERFPDALALQLALAEIDPD